MATYTISHDYTVAKKLQEELNSITKVKEPPKQTSAVDPALELIDPHPDIHSLFIEFNKVYFWGKLESVEVKWSPRMTLCAGVCEYHGRRSGYCSIKLSSPLLKFRPRKDLVETLLHEMIHAYLFVTFNNKDHNDHGAEFHKHMYRINEASGANITVYHSFHAEVDNYRQHWWRCEGICRDKKPFYGYVKRAMNRAPGPNDNWWIEHEKTCGGKFTKIKEPDGYKSQKRKAPSMTGGEKRAIPSVYNTFVSQPAKSSANDFMGLNSKVKSEALGDIKPFQGVGQVLGKGLTDFSKTWRQTKLHESSSVVALPKPLIQCPICQQQIGSDAINTHLDYCLGETNIDQNKSVISNTAELNQHLINTIICQQKNIPLEIECTSMVSAPQSNNDLKAHYEACQVTSIANISECPACGAKISLSEMNNHLDICLS